MYKESKQCYSRLEKNLQKSVQLHIFNCTFTVNIAVMNPP